MIASVHSQIERFSRQLVLPGWSMALQDRLEQLVVAIPLSLPTAALYLAALGVGTIILVEVEQDDPFPELHTHLHSFSSKLRIFRESADRAPIVNCVIRVANAPEAVAFTLDQKLNAELVVAYVEEGAKLRLTQSKPNANYQLESELPFAPRCPISFLAGTLATGMILNWVRDTRGC